MPWLPSITALLRLVTSRGAAMCAGGGGVPRGGLRRRWDRLARLGPVVRSGWVVRLGGVVLSWCYFLSKSVDLGFGVVKESWVLEQDLSTDGTRPEVMLVVLGKQSITPQVRRQLDSC